MSLKGREEFIEEDGGCPRLVWLFQMGPSLCTKTKDAAFKTGNHRLPY
ncbi:MAG: hypothetical protein LM575_06515 [Caldimicrobium sp.]|nr:hypothetical protein [Caldimicrobium sp.]